MTASPQDPHLFDVGLGIHRDSFIDHDGIWRQSGITTLYDLEGLDPERLELVRDVIDSLPPRLLEVVEAVAYEGLPVNQAARRLGTTHSSIRRRLNAIGRLLEEALGDAAL